MEITPAQEAVLRKVTEDFREAMKIRSSMSVRVAKRVTLILRLSMVSFSIVMVVLLLMLYAFTSKMDEMIVALNTMNEQFTSMSKDMTSMRASVHDMEGNIAYVPVITQNTQRMSYTVNIMRHEVENMKGTISSLNNRVFDITNEMDGITQQISELDPAVEYMGRDVNRMSGPMRLFNKFNPME